MYSPSHPSTEAITYLLRSPSHPKSQTREVIKSVEARYIHIGSEPPVRHYHILAHPLELLGLLITNLQLVRDPRAVGWADLYHDSYYDPKAPPGVNEERSAQLAEDELPRAATRHTVIKVARYTRATASHDVDENDEDLNFFLDGDLAILGADPKRYDQYAGNIRREYAHVADEPYRLGRIAILEGLAKRVEHTGLYRTEFFRETCEAQAQENIARETDALKNVAS